METEVRDILSLLFAIDLRFDLSIPYSALSIACGLSCVWSMQCLTHQAGFASYTKLALLGLRVLLALLAIVMLISAGMALWTTEEPWAVDVGERAVLLVLLVVVPRMIGGRRGADMLTRRAVIHRTLAHNNRA